jgi:hypothetical protein
MPHSENCRQSARDALCEQVHDHLVGLGDVFVALECRKGFRHGRAACDRVRQWRSDEKAVATAARAVRARPALSQRDGHGHEKTECVQAR